jgi:hypothetical protein
VYKSKFLAFIPFCADELSPLRRFVQISLTVWPVLGVYMLIDRWQPNQPVEVVMPSWVPFWPVFAVPYVGMLLMTWLLPVAIRDAGRFRACLTALVCAFALTIPWWILTPTTLPRPVLPVDVWSGLYRLIVAKDPPNNVMPCGHGIGPLVAAWFVGRERPTWRWPLAAILALGLPSIALVWQHRPLDILLGTAAAVMGIVVAEALQGRQVDRCVDSIRTSVSIDSKDSK